jgi:ribosome-binding factor A
MRFCNLHTSNSAFLNRKIDKSDYMSGMKKAPYKDKSHGKAPIELGPTQRQLRAGEVVRHALVEILNEEEIHDEALHGISITVTEVRCSPDLRHATVFVEPLGAGLAKDQNAVTITKAQIGPAVAALNTHAKFLRGVLGRRIELKFTPALRFLHDESFNEAARIDALFMRPDIARDLHNDNEEQDEE